MTSDLLTRVETELGTCCACGKSLRMNKGKHTCDNCAKPLPVPTQELRYEALMSARFAIHADPSKPLSDMYFFGYRIFPERP